MTNKDENYKEKDVAFYSATANAWYTTRFEKDKHLLSLSSAGIGLLVTLATAKGVTSICIAAMYIAAVTSFLICVLVVLAIFGRNADHLKNLIQGNNDNDPLLGVFDKTASSSFIFGVVFTLLVGFLSGIETFNQREVVMTDDLDKKTSNEVVKKSVDGAAGIRPSKPTDQPSEEDQGSQNEQSGDSSSEKN